MRTVLSEQQLQTLRTVYASNPRPDALLKEHLVEMTGLSPRVIRVWFQNKRCKDKKKAIQLEAVARQQQGQGGQQSKVQRRVQLFGGLGSRNFGGWVAVMWGARWQLFGGTGRQLFGGCSYLGAERGSYLRGWETVV